MLSYIIKTYFAFRLFLNYIMNHGPIFLYYPPRVVLGCLVNCPIKLNCIIVDLLSNVLILFIFSSFPSTIFFSPPLLSSLSIYEQSINSIFVITQLSYLSFNYAACKKDTDVGKKMKRFCLENF